MVELLRDPTPDHLRLAQGIAEAFRIFQSRPRNARKVLKARFPSDDEEPPKAPHEMVRAMTPDLRARTVNELENGDSMIVAAGFANSDEKLSDYGTLADSQFFKSKGRRA